MTDYDQLFSSRITSIKPSFIREILKAADNPGVISFAGGLPDNRLFPVQALAEASAKIMAQNSDNILQYGQSEGEYALRQHISHFYRQQHNLDVSVDNILITSGSQQGLDLIGKVLINEGDKVVIEAPGYLGAIQSLGLYQPEYMAVDIDSNGVDINSFEQTLASNPKLFYCVPNFQNPTGYSYSETTKKEIADLVKNRNMFIVEDDPYGEICFSGKNAASFYHWIPEQSILLGSFSKTIAPGLRVGWIVAPPAVTRKLLIAKQASDLHSSRLSQCLVLEYLQNNNFRKHLDCVSSNYEKKCRLMGGLLDEYFGDNACRSEPRGGMFMWLKLNDGMNSLDLFTEASARGVVFVPGQSFYSDNRSSNGLRLNFSSSETSALESGVERLFQSWLHLRSSKNASARINSSVVA